MRDSEFREAAKSNLVRFAATARYLALEIEKRLDFRCTVEHIDKSLITEYSDYIVETKSVTTSERERG